MCVCVCFMSVREEVLEKGICASVQTSTGICESVRVCPCLCMYKCTPAPCDPQGQKSRRMRVYNNNTAGSPEQCVNMDTMEMHYAIMAGFMHFSLAGRMGREGEKFGKGKRKQERVNWERRRKERAREEMRR